MGWKTKQENEGALVKLKGTGSNTERSDAANSPWASAWEPGPATESLETVSQLVLGPPERNLLNQSCSCGTRC